PLTTQNDFHLVERLANLSGLGLDDQHHPAAPRTDLTQCSKRNVDRVIFIVLSQKRALSLLQNPDDFERVIAHLHLRADRAFVIPEQSVGDADSNHHGATPMLVVEVANESAIADA